MTPKAIERIIWLMSAATFGIIAIQVYSIARSIELNNDLFEQNVYAALDHVVSKLEQVEIEQTAALYNLTLPDVSTQNTQGVTVVGVEEISTYLDTDSAKNPQFSSGGKVTNASYPKKVFGSVKAWGGNDQAAFMTHFTTYFTHHRIVKDISVEKRLSLKKLDDILKEELKEKDITGEYAYGVYSNMKDTFVLLNAVCNSKKEHYADKKNFKYRINLYPSSNEQVAQLFIDFPNHKRDVLGGIWVNLLGGIIFTGIVIFCFWYTIRVILRQKKLSEMKTDFLNNMTHEFKTPIATISLATDAITGWIKKGKPEKATRFVNIIKEENKRMDNQVGKVLQMARIDKREFKLNISTVDVHQIVAKAADHVSLRIEQQKGSVHLNLKASKTLIEADETHFTNIIHNLLDNAIKYSPENPRITLHTLDVPRGIKIMVEDNGLGISKEARKSIFDKFYRVPTGDVHDIKGFGLGLSYVKAIVTGHAADIDVTSELGKGSTFMLTFPYEHKKEV
ncbi:MAG: HAMP domain-containing histidine kinase [Saprospiraceae bacterium]|nr:HAMP domain-containing histidine kinase [Saprospiraceae bacterium]